MNKEVIVSIRGHHLRLLYGFALAGREESIRQTAIREHGEEHAANTMKVLKDAVSGNKKIKITDKVDDICTSCDKNHTRQCVEFIPYDVSASSDDRATAYNLGIRMNRTYTARYIMDRLQNAGDWI
jgi:hypothetical protein